MAKTDIPEPERLLELSPGLAIWKVHLDQLRERDVNARVMDDDQFRRLTENIRDEGMLESLPLVWKMPGDRHEFMIISGHHRTRASRSAGLMVIPVLVIERELSEDEIISKQLAHNALSGYDNQELLKQLYDSIEDINAKLASGLTDLEINVEVPSIPTDDIDVEFDFEPIYIMFMKSGADRFEDFIDQLEPSAKKYMADREEFNKFAETVQRISKYKDIRNIVGIMSYMLDLASERLEQLEKEREEESKKEAKNEK